MLHAADFLRTAENELKNKPIYNSYIASSVLALCDADGCLSKEVTDTLLEDHGLEFDDIIDNPYDSNIDRLQKRNAEELLHWLGY